MRHGEKLSDGGTGVISREDEAGITVNWEAENAADGGEASDNISTINRRRIPRIRSNESGLFEHCRGTAIGGSNGNHFIKEAIKTLHTHGWMVAFSEWGESQTESSAHLAKNPEKAVIGINNHEGTEAETEEKFHEVLGDGAGQGIRNRDHIHKPGKLVHANQNVGIGGR